MPETKPQHQLKIIIDQKGHKLAENLFEDYIRRDSGNFSRLPEFVLALDKLLSEFGAEPIDEEEIKHTPKSDAKHANKMEDKDEDLDEDTDIHEEASEVDIVKNAILRILASDKRKK
jgi:hypothetical protein